MAYSLVCFRELSRLKKQLKKCRNELFGIQQFLPSVRVPVLILQGQQPCIPLSAFGTTYQLIHTGLRDASIAPSDADHLYMDLTDARPTVLLFQGLSHNVFAHGAEVSGCRLQCFDE